MLGQYTCQQASFLVWDTLQWSRCKTSRIWWCDEARTTVEGAKVVENCKIIAEWVSSDQPCCTCSRMTRRTGLAAVASTTCKLVIGKPKTFADDSSTTKHKSSSV